MYYELNGRRIRIPETILERSIQKLHISRDEAIQLYLEDEGYIQNDEVEYLTTKAKQNKINHDAKSDKKRGAAAKRERKPDEEKENLINLLANCLEEAGINAKITNKTKIIEFSIKDNDYKLDLIKKRIK